MSNMKSLFKRRPVTKWPGNKTGNPYHRTGSITQATEAARTAKQIQNATPVLRDWYAFIEASRKRVP
jgi:hypothetical protein